VDEKPAGAAPWDAFGTYLRAQRQLAQLSLRQLADLTKVSNPYLSQIERGLHQPSIGIIKSLAEALNLSVRDLLAHAADIASSEEATTTTEGAIRGDPLLNDAQKSALLAVYRSMVDVGPSEAAGSAESAESAEQNGSPSGAPSRAQATPKKPATPKKRAPATQATPHAPPTDTEIEPTP
jgi:transcriptional regulator with XRE-family HTH domain